jgi:hypothetical protein
MLRPTKPLVSYQNRLTVLLVEPPVLRALGAHCCRRAPLNIGDSVAASEGSPTLPQPSASTAGLPGRRPHDDLRVVVAAAADTCPQPGSEIATDRPDTTNSGLAVPQGSFQQEKGVNISGREGGQVLDAPTPGCVSASRHASRFWPTLHFFDALSGRPILGSPTSLPRSNGRFSPLPEKIDLSATLGGGMPTGTKAIAGRSVQPYLQFPWSWESAGGWGLNVCRQISSRPPTPSPKRPPVQGAAVNPGARTRYV